MRRRKFLKIMAGGLAAALSPAFLNPVRLPDLVEDGLTGHVIVRRLDSEGNLIEEVRSTNLIVDNGRDDVALPYDGVRKTFRFPLGSATGEVTEIASSEWGKGITYRSKLDKPIHVTSADVLEMTVEYRV